MALFFLFSGSLFRVLQQKWRAPMMTYIISMMTSSNGNIFRATGPLCGVTGEFPAQRTVTRSFDVFFYLHLDKRLSKQSRRRGFETQSRSLWPHSNVPFCSVSLSFRFCGKNEGPIWWHMLHHWQHRIMPFRLLLEYLLMVHQPMQFQGRSTLRGPIPYISNQGLVITGHAHSSAPNAARSSASTVMTIGLDIFSSRFF